VFGRKMGTKLDNVEPRPRCELERKIERLYDHRRLQAAMTIR